MNKNIAIFCDGTWQSLGQYYPTNVSCLARCVAPAQSASGLPQLVFYDDGVGVPEGVLNQATKLLGGGMGEGLDAKIAESYHFLCLNYVPGDHIFIFGFSRGAYSARSLSGLLRKCWILRRDCIGHVDEALAHYRSGELDDPALLAFRQQHCYAMEPFLDQRTANPAEAARAIDPNASAHVQYVGVWDTVGSLGIPKMLPFADRVNDRYRFHDLSLSRFALSARHAVAIDERRTTFAPTLWDNIGALNQNADADKLSRDQRPYQQIWFPGEHPGVGGGGDDGGLSKCPLAWVAEGAERAGLEWQKDILGTFLREQNPLAPFSTVVSSVADEILQLFGNADRQGLTELEDISDSARTRWHKLPTYRPPPLQAFATQLNVVP